MIFLKTHLLAALILGLSMTSLMTEARAQETSQLTEEQRQAQAQQARQAQAQQARQAMLQRIYNLRMQIEQERARDENEARANVRLVTQTPYQRHMDAPSVSAYRQDTRQQLARFEQQFRCLDVDVDSQGGNTVVICGDNSGDISGKNVSAGRDLITVE